MHLSDIPLFCRYMWELTSWAHIWCISGFVLKTRCDIQPQNRKISETILYSGNITIINTYINQSNAERLLISKSDSIFTGTADWGLHTPSTSDNLLKTPKYLWLSSEQQFTTHWGVGEIARWVHVELNKYRRKINDMQGDNKKIGWHGMTAE